MRQEEAVASLTHGALELQRVLDSMTPEERAQYFASLSPTTQAFQLSLVSPETTTLASLVPPTTLLTL